MRRLIALTALCLGVLLFAAPAAWACGELMAMASECPMARSMEDSTCHARERVSMDCCATRSAPEPMQAALLKGATQLAAVSIPVVELPLPVAPQPAIAPGSVFSGSNPGRYTLFSCFLL